MTWRALRWYGLGWVCRACTRTLAHDSACCAALVKGSCVPDVCDARVLPRFHPAQSPPSPSAWVPFLKLVILFFSSLMLSHAMPVILYSRATDARVCAGVQPIPRSAHHRVRRSSASTSLPLSIFRHIVAKKSFWLGPASACAIGSNSTALDLPRYALT